MHRIALLAIVFASLVPSISHALAGQGSTSSFMQEVCGVAGKKVFIQVITTQGNKIETSLNINTSGKSKTINQHINHCPFCHTGVSDIAVHDYNPAFTAYLEAQENAVRIDDIVFVQPQFIQSAHLSRAPPVLS